ncbi:hypothetical protein [Emticicia oligotrophica]|nr:hypothetical protein [Emticicia oligotrophica]
MKKIVCLDFIQESTVKATLLELGICGIRKFTGNKFWRHDNYKLNNNSL